MKPKIQTHQFLTFAFILAFSFSAFAQKQIKLTELDKAKLPAEIKYEGKIKNAVRWSDNLGDNIVITTETGSYQNKKSNPKMTVQTLNFLHIII